MSTTAPTSRRAATQDDGAAAVAAALDGVSVHLGATPVLEEVSFRLGAGEVVGLSGPNGAGKTTLLRVLATLLRPSAGRGEVLGADLGPSVPAEVRRRIAFLAHDSALHPGLTLGENLELVAGLAAVPADRVAGVLGAVGLAGAAERRADRCSRGMIRRAEIARALLVRPALLLLDEAHAGLDADADVLVEALVGDVRRRGGSAVVVSHDAARLAPLADRLVTVDGGSLREVGR